jgi:predicted RNA binding protein YcfA (HicA-like mRNA interferase family)
MKMQQVSSNELIKFLKTRGYEIHHTKGSHFVLIKPNISRVVVPFRNELAIGTILAILRESKISKEEYILFFSRKG